MKLNKNYFEARININNLRGGLLSEIISEVKIPNRKLPRPFFVQDDHSFCVGYFLSYDAHLDGDLILSICKRGDWKLLANWIADLLVLYVDTRAGEIKVMNGQTGKFPCFFSVEEGWVTISTSFFNVRRHLRRLDINLDEVVDSIVWNQASFTSESTIFKQIRRLPPAALLSIDRDLKTQMSPLINRLDMLKERVEPFQTAEEFTSALLDRVLQVVKRHSQAVNGSRIAAELSSGFDSGLVVYMLKNVNVGQFTAYTDYSPYMTEDTNIDTVRKFCQKHGIVDRLNDISELFPFSEIKKLEESKGEDYVTDHGFENHWWFHRTVSGGSEVALFTGDGGDEMYGMYDDTWIRFPIQFNYLSTVGLESWNIGEILTDMGKDILFGKGRYSAKTYYPSPFSSSVTALGQLYFPTFWETGVWPLRPLADPRISEVIKQIPKSLRVPNKRLPYQKVIACLHIIKEQSHLFLLIERSTRSNLSRSSPVFREF